MPVVAALGRARAGARGDEVQVAVDAVGDEGLAARQEVVVAPPHRPGRHRGHVRSRAGLGDAERAHRLARDDAGQVALLLGLGAVAREPGRRHVGVHEHAERHAARPAARHLLAEHHARQEVAAAPAVLDRELEAEQAQLAEPPPEGPRDLPGLLPGVHVRGDLFLDEGAHGAPQQGVLVAEEVGRAHARRSIAALTALGRSPPSGAGPCGRR